MVSPLSFCHVSSFFGHDDRLHQTTSLILSVVKDSGFLLREEKDGAAIIVPGSEEAVTPVAVFRPVPPQGM